MQVSPLWTSGRCSSSRRAWGPSPWPCCPPSPAAAQAAPRPPCRNKSGWRRRAHWKATMGPTGEWVGGHCLVGTWTKAASDAMRAGRQQ